MEVMGGGDGRGRRKAEDAAKEAKRRAEAEDKKRKEAQEAARKAALTEVLLLPPPSSLLPPPSSLPSTAACALEVGMQDAPARWHATPPLRPAASPPARRLLSCGVRHCARFLAELRAVAADSLPIRLCRKCQRQARAQQGMRQAALRAVLRLAPALRARAVHLRGPVGGARAHHAQHSADFGAEVGGDGAAEVGGDSGCIGMGGWLTWRRLDQDDFKEDAQGLSDFYKDKGNALYKLKHFDEAIAYYTKALEANKTNVAVLTNRAAVHFETKNYDACIADCKQVCAVLQAGVCCAASRCVLCCKQVCAVLQAGVCCAMPARLACTSCLQDVQVWRARLARLRARPCKACSAWRHGGMAAQVGAAAASAVAHLLGRGASPLLLLAAMCRATRWRLRRTERRADGQAGLGDGGGESRRLRTGERAGPTSRLSREPTSAWATGCSSLTRLKKPSRAIRCLALSIHISCLPSPVRRPPPASRLPPVRACRCIPASPR